MVNNTQVVRISKLAKYIIEHHVKDNFFDKYPAVKDASIDELLIFLLQSHYKIYWQKVRSEAESGISKL